MHYCSSGQQELGSRQQQIPARMQLCYNRTSHSFSLYKLSLLLCHAPERMVTLTIGKRGPRAAGWQTVALPAAVRGPVA